jgi:hypothetical protein
MEVRRLITLLLISIVAAAIGIFGMAQMASASVSAPRPPAGHNVTVINLSAPQGAALAHVKLGKIGGPVYARGKQPKPSPT